MSSHGWSSLSHTNVEEEGPTHERDDCDIEMEELRMQVQQLQQCLEHYKALSCTESHHNIEHEAPNNEDKDINDSCPVGVSADSCPAGAPWMRE